MFKKKPSLFERLTGSMRASDPDEEDFLDDDIVEDDEGEVADISDEESTSGELAVDVYETPNTIVIKAITAGVKKEGLDITISRREVVIEGSREDRTPGGAEDYIFQELYWGSFSRAIELPEEVEPEEAQAHELHGLLTIILPKIDRNKQTKVRVQ
ncbi:MAG: Hsp20/alpha crystallin family protein [Candidatus Pacebacteria bacterium]|jgi:HSP20 family protein|nr:Hsp20/alpha crystallin family protein [Candidatus Paceibacterota bacterium]